MESWVSDYSWVMWLQGDAENLVCTRVLLQHEMRSELDMSRPQSLEMLPGLLA